MTTSTLYTAAEILQAGRDEIRRTFAHLYAELEELQAAVDWNWHRLVVDENVPLLDGRERLARHAAPAGFGDTAVAIPARTVHLDRLSAAGRDLYQLGRLAGYTDREQVLTDIAAAAAELALIRVAPTRRQRQQLVTSIVRGIDVQVARANPRPAVPVASGAWAVRVPGTTLTLPAGVTKRDCILAA